MTGRITGRPTGSATGVADETPDGFGTTSPSAGPGRSDVVTQVIAGSQLSDPRPRLGGVPDHSGIDHRIERASARPFGRRFHLRGRERATAELRGPRTMRAHAAEIVAERLAPAEPRNDGRQTPYRNHPVFVAQHATATCCRRCLETWHGIAKGHRLDRDERAYVVEVIGRWIDVELAAPVDGRHLGGSTSRRP